MELSQLNPLRKVTAIVNPSSGGSSAPLRELNEAFAPYDSTIVVTQEDDDGSRFCHEAVERGVDLVVVFGGDGTVSQVLGALAGTEVPVLVLRGGTGNLIADELGLPKEIGETLALISGEIIHTRRVDLGKINGKTWCVLRCGCGLETTALQETQQGGKADWGKLAYAGGLLKAIAEQEVIDFRVWIDEASDPIEQSGVALTVANAGRIGVGTLQISPTVDMSDGLLDVCLIEKAALGTLVELLSINRSGNPKQPPQLDDHSLIRLQKARRVRVETGTPVEYQVDGDVVGKTPFEIEVVPGAARLVVTSPPAEEGVSG